MCVNKKQTGHVLLIILVVVALISLFIHNIARIVILEYQRIYNQFLEQEIWQKLEFDMKIFINNEINCYREDNIIGFVADTLEVGCKTGIILHTHTLKYDKQLINLTITYSTRK